MAVPGISLAANQGKGGGNREQAAWGELGRHGESAGFEGSLS